MLVEMAELSEEKITSLFDQLVSENVLVYGPHESIKCEADGYPVSLSIRLTIACTWLITGAFSSSSKCATT